jgi:hypothetical protein
MVVADSARALCLVIISIKPEQKLLVKCEVEIDGGQVFRWIFSSIKSFKRRRKGEKKSPNATRSLARGIFNSTQSALRQRRDFSPSRVETMSGKAEEIIRRQNICLKAIEKAAQMCIRMLKPHGRVPCSSCFHE